MVGDTIYVAAGWIGVQIFKLSPILSLAIDSFTGLPGSSFTLSGNGFSSDADLSVLVNGAAVGTLSAGPTGALSATLNTAGEAAPGLYAVTVVQTEGPGALPGEVKTSYMLQPDAPLRSPPPTDTQLAVPAAIAPLQLHATYLPLTAR